MKDGKQEISLLLDEKSDNIISKKVKGVNREMEPMNPLKEGTFPYPRKNDISSIIPLIAL